MRLSQSSLCSVTGDIRALKELARITCAVLGEAGNGTRALALSTDVPTAELSTVGRIAALGRPQEEMQHLGHPQRGSDKLFSFPLSESRETPAPSPPSTHLMKCQGCVSPGPPPHPDSRLLLGNFSPFCALITACHLEQIPPMTSEIINMLRENFLFLIKAHNSL